MTPCDQCNRGVAAGPWPPKPCAVCKGAGILTAGRLAKLFDVAESTVKGFWSGRRRTRAKTLEKILQKYVQLTEFRKLNFQYVKSKQIQMFQSAKITADNDS